MDLSEETLTSQAEKNDTPKAAIKKSWFTPCRRVGLKRKSTTPISGSVASPSSFISHKYAFITPKKAEPNLNDQSDTNAINSTQTTPGQASQLVKPLQSAENETSTVQGRKTNCTLIKSSMPTTVLHGRLGYCVKQNVPEVLKLEEITEQSVEHLRQTVKEKEERVTALKLAQVCEKKRDIATLPELIKKWRSGCQEALQQLLEKTRSQGYQYTMSELLDHLRIPCQLVQYDPDLEDFK